MTTVFFWEALGSEVRADGGWETAGGADATAAASGRGPRAAGVEERTLPATRGVEGRLLRRAAGRAVREGVAERESMVWAGETEEREFGEWKRSRAPAPARHSSFLQARPRPLSLPVPFQMPPTATLSVEDGVALISLANPPVNALHPDGKEERGVNGFGGRG